MEDLADRDILRKCSALLLSVILSACDQGLDSNQSDTLVFSFSIATPIEQSNQQPNRAFDKSAWSATAKVGDIALTMTPNAELTAWKSDPITLTVSNPVINVVWRYNDLLVADYERTLETATGSTVLEIGPADYRTSGTGFDQDSDGFSNLIELRNDFDPTDNQSPAGSTLGVTIPFVEPASTPIINGLYESSWNAGPSADWIGNRLQIDNLMVDEGADRPDNQTEFNWTGVHDGEYLYLIVFGESSDNATLQSDSTNLWDDDSLNLIIDGDNSKLQEYDKVNDYNWLIPLLDILKPAAPYAQIPTEVNENGDLIRNSNGDVAILLDGIQTFVPTAPLEANNNIGENSPNRFSKNSRSADNEVDILFVNCLCTLGQHIWEIRIKLSDVGIVVGSVFGLELQLDNDIQGGRREARYGWFHPSRAGGVDTDMSWLNPSFTGTAILMPSQPQ